MPAILGLSMKGGRAPGTRLAALTEEEEEEEGDEEDETAVVVAVVDEAEQEEVGLAPAPPRPNKSAYM